MKYINIKTGDIPGVVVTEQAAYCEIAGCYFQIEAFIPDKDRGYIPLLDIPQMSDDQWQALAQKHPAQKATI